MTWKTEKGLALAGFGIAAVVIGLIVACAAFAPKALEWIGFGLAIGLAVLVGLLAVVNPPRLRPARRDGARGRHLPRAQRDRGDKERLTRNIADNPAE